MCHGDGAWGKGGVSLNEIAPVKGQLYLYAGGGVEVVEGGP